MSHTEKDLVLIEEAQLEHLPACHALVKQLADYEKAPNEVSLTTEQFIQDFKDRKFNLIVATQNQKVLGMALFYPIYSTWKGTSMHLEDIVVDEKYRRQGLGKKLFDRVVQQAKKQQVGRLQWQVLNWNQPAIEFYNKYQPSYENDWLTAKLSKEALAQL
ncbi:GNAT family N-acetyltransferase [bacterium]|nr:GNAT family N-acetyltransferase [bacterium]